MWAINGIAPPEHKSALVNISIGEQRAGFVIDLSEPGDRLAAPAARNIIDCHVQSGRQLSGCAVTVYWVTCESSRPSAKKEQKMPVSW